MTRRKLKIPKLQNTKTKNFQSSQKERQIPPLSPLRNFTQIFLKTYKEEKLKTSKLQNSKTKNSQNPQEQSHIPSHQFFF
jgi:hypothetical protein